MAQTMQEINDQWRREGRDFRPRDVADEWKRQGREEVRSREDSILTDYPDTEVAQQIRDHRSAGNYTTQG